MSSGKAAAAAVPATAAVPAAAPVVPANVLKKRARDEKTRQ